MEYSYYGREESNADLRISMAADDCDEIEPLEQLRRVRSPEDVVRLGRAHGEDVAYESIGQADLQKLKREFFALFPNRFGSLIKRANNGEWKQTSQYHYLEDAEILEAIEGKATFSRAVMSDATTRIFAVLIEQGSYYRSSDGGFDKLRDCLHCIGINQLKIYKRLDGDEWQICAFFKKPTDCQKLFSLTSAWLRRNGIVPGTGGIRLYPGSDPFSIPLQPGFAWLNDDGQVIVCRDQISLEAALSLFISDVERNGVNGDEIIERLRQIIA